MKVVGISGTPRKGGNTECLVKGTLSDIVSQERCLKQARALAQNVIQYAEKLKGAK